MHRLTLHAKQDHIEKVVRTSDPLKGISEFVWNGFDAQATTVKVDLRRTPLGGVDEIIISDNGTGITQERADTDFAQLGESWKRAARSSGRAFHGKEGRGRLRFFSLADRCNWASQYRDDIGLKKLSITIAANALEAAEITEPVPVEGDTGTSVSLHPLKAGLDWLTTVAAKQAFGAIFAQYLRLYPEVSLFYDGERIDPASVIGHTAEFPLGAIVGPSRTISDVRVEIVEWSTPMESRRIHFCGANGVVLGSQPARITAPDFSFSVYATSEFFVELAADNLLELDDLTDGDFSAVLERVRDVSADHFRKRSAERAGGLIDELKKAGAYPYEHEPNNEVERREREVFDIATHAVSNYSRDFRRADTSVKRMTLTLLREALRHNPEALTEILHAVVGLPKEKQNQFSSLLQRTQLSNIITASSLIADRVAFLQTLKEAVFDDHWRKVIRERGGLDVLIRDHTWIFGEEFHIALQEVGLTRVMQRVAEAAGKKAPKRVLKDDGKTGRLDSFLGRIIPGPHQARHEYLIIELKRPSVNASRQHLDQITDYARTLVTQPDYANTDTRWSFFLVVGDYDAAVEELVTQEHREPGLAVDKSNYRVWVKRWSEIIRDAEARLQFIQDKLKVQVSDREITERLRALQQSFSRAAHTAEDAPDTEMKGGEG